MTKRAKEKRNSGCGPEMMDGRAGTRKAFIG